MNLPKIVKIVEVGPRDGLQNETQFVPTDIKVEFINLLSQTGIKNIEVTSFVSSQKIPQLRDNSEVLQKINKNKNVEYSALIPNMQGFEEAYRAGVQAISVFTATSETFTQKNINCSIMESFARFEPIIPVARAKKIRVRGYISCAFVCPYEGNINPEKTLEIAKKLLDLGCEEISIGDTIGAGTANQVATLLDLLLKYIDKEKIAVHFHDTYGQALINLYVALNKGINIIDTSISGLGGCPYAIGASGNVATEDVIYMLEGLGIETGIDLKKLLSAGRFIDQYLRRRTQSKVARAMGNN